MSKDPEIEYYLTPGPLTDLGAWEDHTAGLPGDVPSLAKVVQGLILHIFWASRYKQTLTAKREDEVNIRSAAKKLELIFEKDPAPLTHARALPDKLVGNCRDFTVLFTSILRLKGIPARSRCGFGTYFEKGKFVDHWVTEWGNADKECWTLVDSQIDEFQKNQLKLDFDPLNVPRNKFVVAGQAWRMCRNHEQDPRKFGILKYHGMEFILGNVQRDLLALNKIELLPWDQWGLLGKSVSSLKAKEIGLLDKISMFTITPDTSINLLRAIYDSNTVFHPPAVFLQ